MITYLEVYRQDWWQSLDAQLLDGILRAVAIPARILRRVQLLFCGKSIETISEIQPNVIRFVGVLALLLIPYVKTQIHIRIKRCCCIVAFLTCDRALKLTIERLVNYAVAVFRICRAAVRQV
jgi:hypothetical protein